MERWSNALQYSISPNVFRSIHLLDLHFAKYHFEENREAPVLQSSMDFPAPSKL